MHGPCGPQFHFCPTFSDSMTADGRAKIKVVDDFVLTITRFTLIRRAIWRKMRDTALARWEAAGLKFEVTEGPGKTYSDPYASSARFALFIPKTIRFIRNTDDPATSPLYYAEEYAGWDSTTDGSIVCLMTKASWWKQVKFRSWTGVVTHELGHAIGLDHGGGGVMSGNWKPNAHDLESVSRYYLGYNWA